MLTPTPGSPSPPLCSNPLPAADRSVRPGQLAEYRDQFYIPARTVIAASGIRHEVLVELAEQYFGERVFPAREDTVVKTAAVYTGGTSMYKMDESPSNNPLGIPLTHFALGFKVSFGRSANDAVVCAQRSLPRLDEPRILTSICPRLCCDADTIPV